MLNVLDLFSGIGGFSLGLERTGGFRTVAFCEIEPFPRRVLAKHWPEVPCYDDVRTLTASRLRADGISVDAICGGFPCQDISLAGAGAGIGGARSGLWTEFARLIGELRPRYIIVENVAALLVRGLDRVLGDLATLGYDAEWHCIPAAAVGAPHRRDRVWIVGYPIGVGRDAGRDDYAEHDGAQLGATDQHASHVADHDGQCTEPEFNHNRHAGSHERQMPGRPCAHGGMLQSILGTSAKSDRWAVEPDVGRVAHGIPARVDRLRGLGNAVVPQIPELIGRAILAAEAARHPIQVAAE